MSLINRKSQTLIAPCCAGMILDLNESTLRRGKAGTKRLTGVRRGDGRRQRVSFILEVVIALKTQWIESARKPQTKLQFVG